MLQITPSERSTLQLLANGRLTSEIAAILGLAISEVGPYLDALFAKMGAEGRTSAIEAARRRGLLSLNDEGVYDAGAAESRLADVLSRHDQRGSIFVGLNRAGAEGVR